MEESLLDPRQWREARKRDLTEVLAELSALPDGPDVRARRADLLCRLERQADAEFLLLSIPASERSALVWGTLALVIMERQVHLPERERIDLYARIVALPQEVDDEDPGYAEGQYMLDLARGQACAELGQYEEAKVLLTAALRGRRFLGLPGGAVQKALDCLERSPGQRLALGRRRLQEAIISGNPALVQAVADDLAMSAADLHDYGTLAEALEHMRPGPRRGALRDAKRAMLGHRLSPVPDTEATASGLPRVAAYLLAAERALLAEMALRTDLARDLAREVLMESPIITREHDLAREGVMVVDARLLLLADDVAGAASRLAGVTHPFLRVHERLARVEIDLRLEQHEQARESLYRAHEALLDLPELARRWACHLARRLSPNASYLLRELYAVHEMETIRLVSLRHASPQVLEHHRRDLDTHPERVVAFRWLTAPLSVREE